MATIGFDVFRFQLAAYVIAGALGGLAGFLLANATEFVSPAYMSWQRSGELIIMVILGGIGTLHGAIVGAAAYLLLEEWLSGFTENWKVIFGPLLVLVVLFARGGLLGAWRTSLTGARVMAEPVLRLEALRKNFGGLVVTDDVTLDVMPGEMHAIIGPNGAGKTTLINQISGLLTPDAGRIRFAGARRDRAAAGTRAPAWGWRARSRSLRFCPASPRWRTSRSRCRRACGSSFRFFGRAAREAALNEPALAALARGRPRRPRATPGGASVARREARARTRHRAGDGAQAPAARRADGRNRARGGRTARRKCCAG